MNIKKLGVAKTIIIISILIYILYLTLSNVLLPYGIEFRGGVISFIAINKFIFIALGTVLFISSIWKMPTGNLSKLFLTLLSAIMATGTTVFMVMLPYLFTVKGETLAYKEGKLFLAISEPVGLHNTNIKFYEPINFMLMKETNTKGFIDDGASNCYAYGELNFLQNPDFDIRRESEFKDLKPWSAKKKFSNGVFKYLGNETYDFGGIVIKFDSKEIEVKEAWIERNIVKYGGKNIIGENIELVKENIDKVNSNSGIKTKYEEFLDEKDNRNIRIGTEGEYGNFYYETVLIVNNKGIVTSVKYLNDY
ncbi:hypothetical protein FHH43_14135 [Clostridium perfringens]|nr:hypothetical protein [Clostridium perfringens]